MYLSTILTAVALSVNPTADTVAVGHAALRNPRLPVGIDTTEIFATRNGTRQLVSKSTLTVSRVGNDYLIVQVNPTRGGVSIDSIVVSGKDLAPTRHVEAMPNHNATLTFRNGRLTGTSADSTGSHAIDLAVGSRFDFSTLQQVMQNLPLAIGYEAVLLAYDVFTFKERAITFSVIGKDKIAVGASQRDAWKTVTDFGTHKVTRWMDVTTRRDLRWVIETPAGLIEGVVSFGTAP